MQHFLPPAVIRPNVFMPTRLSSAKCIAAPSQMYYAHKCTDAPFQMYCEYKCTDAPSQMYCVYKCITAPSRAKWITCLATMLTLQTCNEPNSTGVEQSLADYIIQAFCRWKIQRSFCKIRFTFHFVFSVFLFPQNNPQTLRSTFKTQRRFLDFLVFKLYLFFPPFTFQCIMLCSYSDNNVFHDF